MNNVIEPSRKVQAAKIETIGDLIDFLVEAVHHDPRGIQVARATAIQINNKHVDFELHEFIDKTRELRIVGF